MIDHDRLFKELIITFFADFIALFFPELDALLDRDSISFLDKELFTDVTAGEKHEADIVAKARLHGDEAYFLIHIENQASAQSDFALRMFRYFARLHEKHALSIYPIAVCSYEAPLRPEPDHYEVRVADFQPLDFRFKVIQLNRLDWRAFLRYENPIASALMARMHIATEDRPRVKLECLRLLATLKLNPARMQLISGFVDTYLRLNAAELAVLQVEIAKETPEEQEALMQITTSWYEEGLERGIEQGLERGIEQGLERGIEQGLERGIERGLIQGIRIEATSIVRMLLHTRIGQLSDVQDQKIDELTNEQLESLAVALMGFQTAADLDNWLRDNSNR